jgi:hypothetical protein
MSSAALWTGRDASSARNTAHAPRPAGRRDQTKNGMANAFSFSIPVFVRRFVIVLDFPISDPSSGIVLRGNWYLVRVGVLGTVW